MNGHFDIVAAVLRLIVQYIFKVISGRRTYHAFSPIQASMPEAVS
jgi:hypothetical protein